MKHKEPADPPRAILMFHVPDKAAQSGLSGSADVHVRAVTFVAMHAGMTAADRTDRHHQHHHAKQFLQHRAGSSRPVATVCPGGEVHSYHVPRRAEQGENCGPGMRYRLRNCSARSDRNALRSGISIIVIPKGIHEGSRPDYAIKIFRGFASG